MPNNERVKAAINYARRGMAVLPLHSIKDGHCTCGDPNCSSPGKHPRTKTGLKEATTDQGKIRDWWASYPDANIGIVTGKASGIVVIDVDGEEGEESLKNLETDYGPLPLTWEQITGGGGRHIVFIRPDWDHIKNRVRLAPGVDIRADDGYIVAEPSNHISGGMYFWEAAHHPDDIPPAEVPAEWLEMFKEPQRNYEPVDIPEIFPQGERNNLMFKLGASLRARGLSDSALAAALHEENRARCNPPLSDKEIDTIAHSCTRYAPGEIMQKVAAREIEAPPVDLNEFTAMLKTEAYYSDAVVGALVVMDNSGSSCYFDAMQQLRAVPGFRERDFVKARSKYIARQRGMKVVQSGDKVPTLDDQLPGIPIKGLVMPNQWRLSKEGSIFRFDEKRDDGMPAIITACPHPVFPIERLHNIDAGTEKLRIAFYRDSRWDDVVVDASTASSRNSIVRLSDRGLQVTSESAKNLVMFMSDFCTANKKGLVMRKSISRLGWVGTKEFAPYAEGVAYDGDLSYQFIYNAVRTEGEASEWMAMAKQFRQSPLLRIILSASFASPLVAYTGYQPFFVHIWGDSGAGKSVAQQMALSVWGDPSKLFKILNTTKVGLERHAAFFHSLPCCFDELQALPKKYMSMEDVIYSLSLGKSKGRGTGAGGVEMESEWHNIFITSGEEPISQNNTAGGAKNRVIELYMDCKAYEPAGIKAEDLILRMLTCYGHVGKMYVDGIVRESGGVRKPIVDLWTSFRDEIANSEYTDKHINNVAMLALGDYFASKIVFGEDETEARAEAIMMAMDVLERIESAAQVDPIRRAWDYFADWVAANMPRFEPSYEGLQARLGWKINSCTDGGDVIMVIPQQLNDALITGGFNAPKSLKGFYDKGCVRGFQENGKTRFTVKRTISGQRQRVIVFNYPLEWN